MAKLDEEIVKKIRDMRADGTSYREIQRELDLQNINISIGSLHNYCNDVVVTKDENRTKIETKKEIEIKQNGDITSDKVITLTEDDMKNPDKVLLAHGFDPNEFEMLGARSSAYQMQLKGGKVKELYASKVTVRAKAPSMTSKKMVEEIEKLWDNSYDYSKDIVYKKGNKMASIEIRDFHLGLLAWHKEVGANFDLTIAKKLYDAAIEHFYQICLKEDGLEQILLVTTDDFIHSDTTTNTTHKGTPQTVDVRWHKMVAEGTELLRKNILKLSKIAPVLVPYVQGNHDTQTTWGIMNVLKSEFKGTKAVTIDTSVKIPMKVVQYGETILGLTHGNLPKQNLRNILQEEAGSIWSNSKYKEIHVGHRHSAAAEEIGSMLIEQDGTITGSSDWEKGQGYHSKRQCHMRIYDRELGRVAVHTFTPDMVQDLDLRKELRLDEKVEEKEHIFVL